jgi:hypothetical protein
MIQRIAKPSNFSTKNICKLLFLDNRSENDAIKLIIPANVPIKIFIKSNMLYKFN